MAFNIEKPLYKVNLNLDEIDDNDSYLVILMQGSSTTRIFAFHPGGYFGLHIYVEAYIENSGPILHNTSTVKVSWVGNTISVNGTQESGTYYIKSVKFLSYQKKIYQFFGDSEGPHSSIGYNEGQGTNDSDKITFDGIKYYYYTLYEPATPSLSTYTITVHNTVWTANNLQACVLVVPEQFIYTDFTSTQTIDNTDGRYFLRKAGGVYTDCSAEESIPVFNGDALLTPINGCYLIHSTSGPKSVMRADAIASTTPSSNASPYYVNNTREQLAIGRRFGAKQDNGNRAVQLSVLSSTPAPAEKDNDYYDRDGKYENLRQNGDDYTILYEDFSAFEHDNTMLSDQSSMLHNFYYVDTNWFKTRDENLVGVPSNYEVVYYRRSGRIIPNITTNPTDPYRFNPNTTGAYELEENQNVDKFNYRTGINQSHQFFSPFNKQGPYQISTYGANPYSYANCGAHPGSTIFLKTAPTASITDAPYLIQGTNYYSRQNNSNPKEGYVDKPSFESGFIFTSCYKVTDIKIQAYRTRDPNGKTAIDGTDKPFSTDNRNISCNTAGLINFNTYPHTNNWVEGYHDEEENNAVLTGHFNYYNNYKGLRTENSSFLQTESLDITRQSEEDDDELEGERDTNLVVLDSHNQNITESAYNSGEVQKEVIGDSHYQKAFLQINKQIKALNGLSTTAGIFIPAMLDYKITTSTTANNRTHTIRAYLAGYSNTPIASRIINENATSQTEGTNYKDRIENLTYKPLSQLTQITGSGFNNHNVLVQNWQLRTGVEEGHQQGIEDYIGGSAHPFEKFYYTIGATITSNQYGYAVIMVKKD